MPNLPDIPGKGLIRDLTGRTRDVVAAAGSGALAAGGFVAKRVLDRGHRDGDDAVVDPIAERPAAPPEAEEKPVPKPKPVKPKPGKPKPAPKAKPDKPKAEPKDKPKPPKPPA